MNKYYCWGKKLQASLRHIWGAGKLKLFIMAATTSWHKQLPFLGSEPFFVVIVAWIEEVFGYQCLKLKLGVRSPIRFRPCDARAVISVKTSDRPALRGGAKKSYFTRFWWDSHASSYQFNKKSSKEPIKDPPPPIWLDNFRQLEICRYEDWLEHPLLHIKSSIILVHRNNPASFTRMHNPEALLET